MDKSELSIVKRFLDPYYAINSDEEFYALLKSINSSECLHVLASEINWDGASEEIEYILNHKNCDRGTALLCYWYNQPGYWSRKSAGSINDYEIDSFKLHQTLEDRLLNGFYNASRIRFDPRNHEGINWVSEATQSEQKTIPETLKEPSEGEPLESINWEKI